MKKYWTLFRIALENNMAYRGRALIWMLFDLLWIGVFPFIWFTIIQLRGGEVAGWSGSMIIVYYILMMVLSNIVFLHPEAFMAGEIYSGKFSNYLIKPHSYLGYVFLHEISYKIVRFVLFFPFFIPLFFVVCHFGGFSVDILPQLGFAGLAALLGIPIFFLSAYIIGLTSFWLEDSYSARTIFWATSGLFGGQYAPFELMPRFFEQVAAVLPFKYALYFPLRVASAQLTSAQLLTGFSMQLVWIFVLVFLTRIVWIHGVRAYSAVGR